MFSGLCDFRVKQSAWRETLNIYYEIKTQMESERDIQKENAKEILMSWISPAATTFEAGTKFYYDEGKYAIAHEKITSMHQLMYDSMSTINTLLRMNENFLANITSDERVYTSEISAESEETINGGILSLNYFKISKIDELCKEICEDAKAISSDMKATMGSCSDLVSGIETCQDMVDSACQRVQRLENYRCSFQEYAADIKDLESDINSRLLVLIPNPAERLARSTAASIKSITGNSNKSENCLIQNMTGEEVEAFVEYLIESDNIEEMQELGEQILAKDVSEWSESELYFVTHILDYGFETENVVLVEDYVESMIEVTEVEGETQVNSNTEVMRKVIAELEDLGSGKASSTLSRITQMSLYHGDIQICFEFDPTADLRYSYPEQKITVFDMDEVVTLEEQNILVNELGFTNEQVELMRESAITDGDVVFLDQLTSRDYEAAFDVKPEAISQGMSHVLSAYIMNLEQKDEIEELETLVNGLLKTDPDNCLGGINPSGKYIKLIRANYLEYIDAANANVILLQDGSAEEKALISRTEEIYKQYELWTSIDLLYNNEMGLDKLWVVPNHFVEGYYYAEIYDLSPEAASTDARYDYKFDIKYINEEGKACSYLQDMVGPDAELRCYISKIPGKHLAEMEVGKQISELKKEQDLIPWKCATECALMFVDSVVPGTSDVVNATYDFTNDGYENMIETYEEVINSELAQGILGNSDDASGIQENQAALSFAESVLPNSSNGSYVSERDQYESYLDPSVGQDIQNFHIGVEIPLTSGYLTGMAKSEELLDSKETKLASSIIGKAAGAYGQYVELTEQINGKEILLLDGLTSQGFQIDFQFRIYELDENGSKTENFENYDNGLIKIADGIILPQVANKVYNWKTDGVGAYLKEEGFDETQINDIRDELKDVDEGAIWNSFIYGSDSVQLTDTEEFSMVDVTNKLILLEDQLRGREIQCDIYEWLGQSPIESED